MSTKTKLTVLFSVLLAVALSGCGGPQTTAGAAGDGGTVTTTTQGQTTTVNYSSPEGEGTMTITEGTGPVEWCKAGTSWNWAGAEGQGNWVMTGFESYKGKEYCHVAIDSLGGGEEYAMDYYFIQENDEVADLWMVTRDGAGNIINEMHVSG